MKNSRIDKKARAKKRVEMLKGFYVHLTVYIAVNTFTTVLKVIRNLGNGETFGEAFWDTGTFFVWGAWGIGLAFHAAKVFSINPFFNKEWEERQIRKFMDEDQKDAESYRSMPSDYGK